MKVVQLCQTDLLGSELHELLVSDPRNSKAFGELDPQDDRTVLDSDDLRRLVNTRRVVRYLEEYSGVKSLHGSRLVETLERLRALGVSAEQARRLIDGLPLTSRDVYCHAIFQEEDIPDETTLEKVFEILSDLNRVEA
jgi:hypothetical protein